MTDLTWDATDLDNADSEDGVVHESVANSDHDDNSVLKQGYRLASPFLASDTIAYYALQEDSGTIVNDFSGNANDATNSGATVGQTGLLGTTSYSFDGTDDFCEGPEVGYTDPVTLSIWMKSTQTTASSASFIGMFASDDSSGVAVQLLLNANGGGILRGEIFAPQNTYTVDGSTQINDGNWHHCVFMYDSSQPVQGDLFVDATKETVFEIKDGNPSSAVSEEPLLGTERTKGVYFDGRLADARIFNRKLTASEIQTLYDVVATDGSLITASKTS